MPGPMRGFTLLEVLIALVVVAVTLAAATAAIGGAARRQRGLEERTFATWAAHNTLGRLRLDGLPGDHLERQQPLAGERLQVTVQAHDEEALRRLELVVHRVGEDEVLARLTGFLPMPMVEPLPGAESPPQPAPAGASGPVPEPQP
jgi:general secretion pathway protein I